MDEHPLDQARRHVHEGEERVTQQRARVDELRSKGLDVEQGRELLSEMEHYVALARDHLVIEEEKYGSGKTE